MSRTRGALAAALDVLDDDDSMRRLNARIAAVFAAMLLVFAAAVWSAWPDTTAGRMSAEVGGPVCVVLVGAGGTVVTRMAPDAVENLTTPYTRCEEQR